MDDKELADSFGKDGIVQSSSWTGKLVAVQDSEQRTAVHICILKKMPEEFPASVVLSVFVANISGWNAR